MRTKPSEAPALISPEQEAVCQRYDVSGVPSLQHLKVGIARNVREGVQPVNGLRIHPAGTTTGWYIWAGTEPMSEDPDFFLPLHVNHLEKWCPAVLPYLALPPGWRFLVVDDYEDVWSDPELLKENGGTI